MTTHILNFHIVGSISKGQAFVSANDDDPTHVKVATLENLLVSPEPLGVAREDATDSTFEYSVTGDVIDETIHGITSTRIPGKVAFAVVDTKDGSLELRTTPAPGDTIIGTFSAEATPKQLTIALQRATGITPTFQFFDPRFGYNGLDKCAGMVFNEILHKHGGPGCIIEIGWDPNKVYTSEAVIRWDEIWIDHTEVFAIPNPHNRRPLWHIDIRGASGALAGGTQFTSKLQNFGDADGFNNCGKQLSILEVSGSFLHVSIPQQDIWPIFANDKPYERGDRVRPATRNGYVYRCFKDGRSQNTGEPIWETTIDKPVSSGTSPSHAQFMCEPERPMFPINPREWIDHPFVIDRAANTHHNGRFIVASVINDGADGKAIELWLHLRGAFSPTAPGYDPTKGGTHGNVTGKDTNNGTIAWSLLRSVFQVRQRAVYFRDIGFFAYQGYYAGFWAYITQSPYYGSSVISDVQFRRCSFNAYAIATYDPRMSLLAYDREIAMAGTTTRRYFMYGCEAVAWPIALQPGQHYYRAHNGTAISTWQAGKLYNVGDLVRGTDGPEKNWPGSGWWWECTRGGTSGGTSDSDIPPAMNNDAQWGKPIDGESGRPEWRAVFAGGTSSRLQTPWTASTPVSLGEIRRFTSQTATAGGGYNLRCIKAGVTGAAEPVLCTRMDAFSTYGVDYDRAYEVHYAPYDKIIDGTAEWRLEYNAGIGNLFFPYNCDFLRNINVTAQQAFAFLWMDNIHGQSREHIAQDLCTNMIGSVLTDGWRYSFTANRYLNEYGRYGQLTWNRGELACSITGFNVKGNSLDIILSHLHAESNSRIFSVHGPGAEFRIESCRLTSDLSMAHRGREWANIGSAGAFIVNDIYQIVHSARMRASVLNQQTRPISIRWRKVSITAPTPIGYPARAVSTNAGPWRLKDGDTWTFKWTDTSNAPYYVAGAETSYTTTLRILPAVSQSGAPYAVGDLVVAPGKWSRYQYRCIVGGTTSGPFTLDASSIGQIFTNNGVKFVSEDTTQPQNLLEVHAWELAAAFNRDCSREFRVKWPYNKGDIVVPWDVQEIEVDSTGRLSRLQYRVTNVTTVAAGSPLEDPYSGESIPQWPATIGAKVVSGGVTFVCEELNVPAWWAFADGHDVLYCETHVSGPWGQDQEYPEGATITSGMIGNVIFGCTGGTGNSATGLLGGRVTYGPHEADVLCDGLITSPPSENAANTRANFRDYDIDVTMLGTDTSYKKNIRCRFVSDESAPGAIPRTASQPLDTRSLTLVSSQRTPLRNDGFLVRFYGESKFAPVVFPKDFEFDSEYQADWELKDRDSGVTNVGMPVITPTKYGFTATRAAAPGAGKSETWRVTLRRAQVPLTARATDGSVSIGGTVFTTPASALSTSYFDNGCLRILSGACKGDYKVLSTTATTITITGATFPVTHSSIAFELYSSDHFSPQTSVASATMVGRYEPEDLATLTTAAAWDSSGGTGWVNTARTSAYELLGTLWQNTDAAVPMVSQDATNGYYYASFDGNKYIKTTAALAKPYEQPVFVFIVMRVASTDSADQVVVDGHSTQFWLYVRPYRDIINLNAGSSGSGVRQELQAGWLVIAAKLENKQLRYPNISGRITVNGVYPGMWMRTPPIGGIGSNPLDGLTIGADRNGNSKFKGDVHAVYIFKGDMSRKDEARVTQYFLGKFGIGAKIISSEPHGGSLMSRSIRSISRGVYGRSLQNFQWNIIRRQSVVHVTASEVAYGPPSISPPAPNQDWRFHIGDANVWVSNISPHYRNDPGDDG